MKIGETIKEAREGMKLTQQQLAEKADISRVYLWQLETDQKAMSLEVFFRLCAALGISAATMIKRIERAN